MNQESIIALIQVVPQLLLILIIGVVLLVLRRPLFEKLLPRVWRLSLIGVEVELQPAEVRKALEAQTAPSPRPLPSDQDLGAVGQRAERNAAVLVGRTAVCVDDHPEWTVAERLVMQRIGLFVEPVRTTSEAAAILEKGLAGRPVDLLLSDIGSEGGDNRLADVVDLAKRHNVALILYVGSMRPGVPPGAFGITNRPHELWHLVMDALERGTSLETGASRS